MIDRRTKQPFCQPRVMGNSKKTTVKDFNANKLNQTTEIEFEDINFIVKFEYYQAVKANHDIEHNPHPGEHSLS